MSRSLAVLFKAGTDESGSGKDPYTSKLAEIGIDSLVVSVLSFEFINLDQLTSCIEQNESYSGIIFSSPRVVEAVVRCSADIVKWRCQFAFAVGEKTAEQVRRIGLFPVGGDSGTGAALADFILTHDIQKPLLLPCGNLSTNTLYEKLSEGGIAVKRLVVYQTAPNPDLERNMHNVMRQSTNSTVKFVLYFSPSGVSATMPIFSRLNIDLSLFKFGAIGPTTEAALSSYVNVSFVAEKPTPEHFAEAVKRTFSSEHT